MKKFVFILLLTISLLYADPSQQTLADALQTDYQAGQLSRTEFVAYRLMGIINHPDLPSRYQDVPRRPSPMGTTLMMEARALVPQSSGVEKELLESVLSRPDYLPLSQTSPSGLFKLHYTDQGMHAAADTFIARCALAYDEVYDLIIHEMGYDTPPIDDPADPEYDVYVYAVGGYGLSTPETPAPTAKYSHGVTSYISMDNTFERTFTRGIDGMLVTAAHEFFHMVQLGMRNFSTTESDSRFLFEGTATWMEDYAFNHINDYLQYLPSYMRNLSKSFNTFNGLHEYGSCIFYHMLEAKYGADIIKDIWSEFAQIGLWEGYDAALQRRGSSFKKELASHMVWNYFTGLRARSELYYPEGEFYPIVEPDDILQLDESLAFSDQTDFLGAHFIKIEPASFGELMVAPTLQSPMHWLYSVIEAPLNAPAKINTSSGGSSLLLSGINPANDIYLIPTNVNMSTATSYPPGEGYEFNLTFGQMDDLVSAIQNIYPNPYQPMLQSSAVQIDVRLIEKTDRINYYILNEFGRPVFSDEIRFESPLNGDVPIFWDGRNAEGKLVSAGIYIVRIDADQDIEPGKIAVVR